MLLIYPGTLVGEGFSDLTLFKGEGWWNSSNEEEGGTSMGSGLGEGG